MPEKNNEVKTKVINLPHPNCDEVIALGVQEIAAILGAVLNITSGDSEGTIEGIRFASVPIKNAIFVPGQSNKTVPCILLKVDWKKKEDEKDEKTIPIQSV